MYGISPYQYHTTWAGQTATEEEMLALRTPIPATTAIHACIALIPVVSAVASDADTRALDLATPELADVTRLRRTSFVQFLSESQLTVQSERVSGSQSGKEAFATLPIELTGVVPDNYQPGGNIIIPSPDGDIEVEVPPNTQPGSTVRYRLAPTPELRVQVPPGLAPGQLAKFRRNDGLEIEVPVPSGLKPGDFFDVDPPAVMVRVPESTSPGDAVVFRSLRRDGQDVTEWCRALVPQGMAPGRFFVARLPPPLKRCDNEDDTSSSEGTVDTPKRRVPKKRKEESCCWD